MPVLDTKYRIQPQSATFLEGASLLDTPATLDSDDWKYRKFKQGSIDLDTTRRDEAIRGIESFYLASPLAKRLTRWMIDFVVGTGFTLHSPDAEANKVLNTFWNSPVNDLAKNTWRYIQELYVYGELALLAKVNDISGFVGLNFIPSTQIESVTEVDGEPGEAANIVLKSESTYNVIRWRNGLGRYDGDCFFFRTDRLGGHVRGYPVLLALLDWINVWETFLYNKIERDAQFSGVWFDVMLRGKTAEDIKLWLKEQRDNVPGPGTIQAHNEGVEWNMVQPRSIGIGLSRDAKLAEEFITSTAGLLNISPDQPESGEMLNPTVRGLIVRQEEIKDIFLFMGRYAIQEAIVKGVLRPGEYKIYCLAPRLGVRDIQRSAGAIVRITESLVHAQEKGWLDQSQAAKIYTDILHHLNFITEPLFNNEDS